MKFYSHPFLSWAKSFIFIFWCPNVIILCQQKGNGNPHISRTSQGLVIIWIGVGVAEWRTRHWVIIIQFLRWGLQAFKILFPFNYSILLYSHIPRNISDLISLVRRSFHTIWRRYTTNVTPLIIWRQARCQAVWI